MSSGRQALQHLARSKYDAIVTDVSMSPMSGIELTRAVRRNAATARTPVLLVSARFDETGRTAGLSAGADVFVSKRECAEGRLLEEVTRAVARRSEA